MIPVLASPFLPLLGSVRLLSHPHSSPTASVCGRKEGRGKERRKGGKEGGRGKAGK